MIRFICLIAFWLLPATAPAQEVPEGSPALTLEPGGPSPTPMPTPPESDAVQVESLISNIHASAALDLYAPVPIQNAPVDGDRFRVRAAELMIAGPVDSVFDGAVTLAGHDDSGLFEVSLHEGYIGSSKLIPNSRIKLGKFFLGVGHLNQIHRHSWSFTAAPKSHVRFFADENVADSGLEYSVRFGKRSNAELTVGVTNGYCYGHCHGHGGSGNRPLAPVHYAHPVFSFDFENGGQIQTGLTYLGRTEPDGKHVRLAGVDFIYSLRLNHQLEWLVQSEFYHQYSRPGDTSLPLTEEIGGYVYTQKALNQKWQTGLRLDVFTTPSLRMPNGDKRWNLDYGFVPVVSYKASGASTVRLSYTYWNETRQGDSDHTEQRFELQLVATLGNETSHDH